MPIVRGVTVLAFMFIVGSRAEAQGRSAPPLYENLGRLHVPVTTTVPLAQRYFDQGLRLAYAFNHAEAIRAFAEGERLDSTCAMCAWGIALASGPNINAPMDSAGGALAYAAVVRARARAAAVRSDERAMIEALVLRYSASPTAARPPLDSAYAAAMGEVADRFPDNTDAQVLHAEALMTLSPWNYWAQGAPRPATPLILARLEAALAADADHPGACHFFIHAVEAQDARRAVPCAERLATLMPGAGHIVHMPGHIYIRVGRYAEAIEANEHAVHADESYLEGPQVNQRGMYPQGYYPHNYHFMSFAASLAGASSTAIEAARKVQEKVGPAEARALPWLEAVTPVVWTTLVTFGRWDDILAEPVPPADLRFTTGMAYYARGTAFSARKRWAEARAALDTVAAIAAVFPKGENQIALAIARESLAGEIALRQGRADAAVAAFQAAVALENGLPYTEPPYWYYPARQSLGKALLAAGRAPEAERVYREDLEHFPDNGWSLYGLAASLDRQGKGEEARAARARFAEAWKGADVKLSSSRF